MFFFSAAEANFGFPLTPDSGSDMAHFPSPANSPARSSSPSHSHDFFDGPPSPVDEGIGFEFQRLENTRKRKVSVRFVKLDIIPYKSSWGVMLFTPMTSGFSLFYLYSIRSRIINQHPKPTLLGFAAGRGLICFLFS